MLDALHPVAAWLLQAGAVATALLAVIGLFVKLAPIGKWLGGHVANAIVESGSQQLLKDEELLSALLANLSPAVAADVERRLATDVAEDVEARLSGTLGQVLSQVTPNGGSSMRDDIHHIKKVLDDHLVLSDSDRRRLWHELRRLNPDLEVPSWHHHPGEPS